jgi:signal transduction histidine kinase/ActR/RegA family two-component response regulator
MASLQALIRQGEVLPPRTSVFASRNLLAVYLLAIGLNSCVFYLFPSGYYDHNVNLVFSLACFALLPLTRFDSLFSPLVHIASLLSVVLVGYIAMYSGGVNSTVLVWLNLVSLPVLMLRGPQAALQWIGFVLLVIFGVYQATDQGWISGHALVSPQAVPWAVMQNVLGLASLMLCVVLFDLLHDKQLQQLDSRNKELKSTHEALLKAQAHKDEFLAAVGHELRTPMNAILGFNGVLREELSGDPEDVEVVDHIRRSTQHLLQVVNDILDFSQLQANKLALFTVDFGLAELMEDALQPLRERARSKGIEWLGELDPQLPARLHGDPQRLRQILSKLLDNALKFTATGAVRLRIRARDEDILFEVIDTGRGIPLAQQAHIFRRFEHADVQTTRTYGGTGLGLSICEKLVLLHGGQIGVNSQEGQGAAFWFQIPKVGAKVASLAPTAALQADAQLRILVVDDNALNLMVARMQLQKCWPKAQVVTADSAAQALVLLDGQTFDVALIDMVMPEMDGMALTRQIRLQFPAITQAMPIIALTANTNPVDRQRCLDAGMDAVLDKPMDLEQLTRCVSQHIQRARG